MVTNPLWEKLKGASQKALEKAEIKSGIFSSKESLSELVKRKLGISQLILVSNREPYIHIYQEDTIKSIRYASGLTIALDSIAQTCDTVWVAHGSGEADWEVVDEQNKVKIPPESPSYYLKRIKLSKAEEDGYYNGFSNEVMWPLCHLAYVRPKFDQKTWEIYQKVNKKFAEAVLEEVKSEVALIFIQDYHLSLCARYIKEQNPNLITILFWHIPWPNPEIFRICPWKMEILEGLLANDILGFHLRYHGDNFLKTVALEMEAKIDNEKWSVQRSQQKTFVRAYPISVDFDRISRVADGLETQLEIQKLKKFYRLDNKIIGLGVDRIDYTKGILERLKALDYFFENNSKYTGKLVFIQIGVPSRLHIEDYQETYNQIENEINRINWKYALGKWSPIIFINEPKDFKEIVPFYKMADFCVVSSLHDGMNLVAKEYVASKTDLNGVLVLSRFTGSARELEQSLLVNPYHIEDFAEIIKQAVELSQDEKIKRMEKLRTLTQEHNIYLWAEKIISDLAFLT